jgi:hypothetical protein
MMMGSYNESSNITSMSFIRSSISRPYRESESMRLSFLTNNGVLGIRRGNVGVVAVFGTLIAGSDWSIASVGPCFRTGIDLNLRRTRWKGIAGWCFKVCEVVCILATCRQRVRTLILVPTWLRRSGILSITRDIDVHVLVFDVR